MTTNDGSEQIVSVPSLFNQSPITGISLLMDFIYLFQKENKIESIEESIVQWIQKGEPIKIIEKDFDVIECRVSKLKLHNISLDLYPVSRNHNKEDQLSEFQRASCHLSTHFIQFKISIQRDLKKMSSTLKNPETIMSSMMNNSFWELNTIKSKHSEIKTQ
eukprot:gene4331-5421_t